MPDEELADLLDVGVGIEQVGGEQQLGKRGGVVLESGRECQLIGLRSNPGEYSEHDANAGLVEAGGVAQLPECLVEGPVFATVDGLLADEARHLLAKHRVGDPVPVVAHRPYEEVLAIGEQAAQHHDHVALHEVTLHEVLG